MSWRKQNVESTKRQSGCFRRRLRNTCLLALLSGITLQTTMCAPLEPAQFEYQLALLGRSVVVSALQFALTRVTL